MKHGMRGKRGRILRVKLGYNPNSSSLGTEIQALLLGSAALSFLTVLLSSLVRLTRRKPAAPEAGDARDHHL